MKKIFYTHIHKPTMTVKVGVTNKFNSRMKWEANQWKRDPADYEIVHKVKTLMPNKLKKIASKSLSSLTDTKSKIIQAVKYMPKDFIITDQ